MKPAYRLIIYGNFVKTAQSRFAVLKRMFMQLSKEDLRGQHYTWTENQPPAVFSGDPSRRIFDRYNGEQVLFIINYYGSRADKFTIEEGRAIEERILNQLPVEVKSELSVFNWLRGGY